MINRIVSYSIGCDFCDDSEISETWADTREEIIRVARKAGWSVNGNTAMCRKCRESKKDGAE